MQKIFAIGDIHGCFDKLQSLLAKIHIDFARDSLVFLGDYVDRGPDSFEVVEYLTGLKRRYPQIVFLKGNHEEMLLDYLLGVDQMGYLLTGGRQTMDSYLKQPSAAGSDTIPTAHRDFYETLTLYHETEQYFFAHAGLKPKVLLADQSPHDLLWIRQEFIRSTYDFGKQVVFGHTPLPKPLVTPNKIGIDTGAVYGGKLTCVELPVMNFYDA